MRARRSLFENPPATGLVQAFIDSAYDTVKVVADNIEYVILLGDQILTGDDLVTETVMNAAIADAVDGLYEHMGTYDAVANTPDLTTAPNAIEEAQTWVVNTNGTFYGEPVASGDLLISNVDNPTNLSDWSIINRNIDEGAFATAAQGALADTALQAGDVGSAAFEDVGDFATAAQGATADTALQPGANISSLTNDLNFADDMTPAEIKAAYEGNANTNAFDDDYLLSVNYLVQGQYSNVEEDSSTSYTLVMADAGGLVITDNAAAVTVTVPPQSSVAWPGPVKVDVLQLGAGATSIVAGAGVTLHGELDLIAQYAMVSLIRIATNEWVVIGGTTL